MNAKTGFWSAFGALVGGFAGATAGKYAAQNRYVMGTNVADAMVVGGAAGATVGAFVGGAVASGNVTLPKLTT